MDKYHIDNYGCVIDPSMKIMPICGMYTVPDRSGVKSPQRIEAEANRDLIVKLLNEYFEKAKIN